MRTLLYSSCCLLTVLTGTFIYAADIDGGFSGLKWATHKSMVDNLVELSGEENVGYYVKPDEVYVINDVRVAQVVYGFYQKKFFAVYFTIKSNEDFEKIKQYFIIGYGTPRAQLRVNQTVYIWEHGEVKIKMKLLKKADTHKLAYYYTPLSNKLNESRLEDNFEQYIKLVPKN